MPFSRTKFCIQQWIGVSLKKGFPSQSIHIEHTWVKLLNFTNASLAVHSQIAPLASLWLTGGHVPFPADQASMAGREEMNVDAAKENEDKDDTELGELDKSERTIKLPLTRIKHFMKMDPDVSLASQDAVIMIAKATVSCKNPLCLQLAEHGAGWQMTAMELRGNFTLDAGFSTHLVTLICSHRTKSCSVRCMTSISYIRARPVLLKNFLVVPKFDSRTTACDLVFVGTFLHDTMEYGVLLCRRTSERRQGLVGVWWSRCILMGITISSTGRQW